MAQSRIPIVVCHGVQRRDNGWAQRLTAGHFDRFMRTAKELGFESITYDGLAAWQAGARDGPSGARVHDRPRSPGQLPTPRSVRCSRQEYQLIPTLFVVTGPLDGIDLGQGWEGIEFATWPRWKSLARAGWLIGAHTVTHPDLSELSLRDPSGHLLRAELDDCISSIERHLGLRPQDFAFTGTSFSAAAEQAVADRFRFGRLWIVGASYQANRTKMCPGPKP